MRASRGYRENPVLQETIGTTLNRMTREEVEKRMDEFGRLYAENPQSKKLKLNLKEGRCQNGTDFFPSTPSEHRHRPIFVTAF